MPFVTDLANAVGGNLASGIADLVRLFKVDPNLAMQNQTEVLRITTAMQSKVMDATAAEVQAASANIQAEAKSSKSAPRPLFMYLIEAILAFNYIAVPIHALITHKPIAPFDLPSNLLVLFGVCLTGYTTFDQIRGIMALPGDSSVQIPGVKIGNKS